MAPMDPPISVATSDLKTPPIQALASGELAPVGNSVDISPSLAAVDNPLTSSTSAVSSVPSPATSNLKTSADQAAVTAADVTSFSNSGGTTGLGNTAFSVEQDLIGKPVATTPTMASVAPSFSASTGSVSKQATNSVTSPTTALNAPTTQVAANIDLGLNGNSGSASASMAAVGTTLGAATSQSISPVASTVTSQVTNPVSSGLKTTPTPAAVTSELGLLSKSVAASPAIPAVETPLSAATRDLKTTLTQAAASGELGRVAGDSLGLLSVPESFWDLQQAWAKGKFTDFPSISLLPGSSMADAHGAYVAKTDTILINQDWLAKASSSQLLAVLAEEVGHSLDTRFNSSDTPGDEGELFSRLLLGQIPSASELARIKSEDDGIPVTLTNGVKARGEAADVLAPVVRRTGTTRSDQLVGGNNNDSLFGLAGEDSLVGGAGNDYLDGGLDNDRMEGGSGDDVYIVDSSSDLVLEAVGEGNDSILSSVSLALPDNVENLDLRTTDSATGQGNDLDNVIYGGTGPSRLIGNAGNDSLYGRGTNEDLLEGGLGNDFLDGGQGNDLMAGGKGDDTYVVRDALDQVIEAAASGNDWVYATTTYALSENVENLRLFGTSDGGNATGNSQNNTLIGDQWKNGLSGGAGDDYLDGGAGADQMDGGIGNDTYVVNDLGDTIVEISDGGTDWVVSTVNQTLASNVEHLDFRGEVNLIGIGNQADNIIKGNLGNTTMRGGGGNDSLYGRGTGSDSLYGEEGDDYLDGGAGADTMDGGIGDDTYIVDNANDKVIELTDGGSDWVINDVSYALGENLEGLRLRGLTGAEDINGSGNELNNTIYGNSGMNILSGGGGNDILNGGAGSDTMVGGAGSDLFVMNNKEANGSIAMDKVGDFQTGTDMLYLSRTALNIDASRLGSGVLKASDFKLVNSNTEGGLNGANGLSSTAAFVFDQSSGILYHNSNGSELGAGDSNPGGIMDMSGAMLKASDIQLI